MQNSEVRVRKFLPNVVGLQRGAWPASWLSRRYSILTITALLLSACLPTVENPLFDPGAPEPDATLVGQWVGTISEAKAHVHFLPQKDGSTDVVIIASKDDGNAQWMALRMLISRIGQHRFMSLKILAPRKEAQGIGQGNYLLLRYEAADGDLSVWMMANDAWVSAVSDGLIDGDVRQGSGAKTVAVSSTPEKLAAFIAGSNATELFPHQIAWLERID